MFPALARNMVVLLKFKKKVKENKAIGKSNNLYAEKIHA